VEAAGRIALILRVFAQLDQQAANFRHMMALQGRERKDVIAFIAIRQRAARTEIGLKLFIRPGKYLQVMVLRRPAVGHGFQAGEGSLQFFSA
jgi:autonomous glycyl radical cofactor GrcA